MQRLIREHLCITVCLDAGTESMPSILLHARWCTLKTFLGAWKIAHRLRPGTCIRSFNCVCDATEDSLLVHAGCDDIWTLSFSTAGMPPTSYFSERLHVLLATEVGLKNTAVAYAMFHCLKDQPYLLDFEALERTALIAWRVMNISISQETVPESLLLTSLIKQLCPLLPATL